MTIPKPTLQEYFLPISNITGAYVSVLVLFRGPRDPLLDNYFFLIFDRHLLALLILFYLEFEINLNVSSFEIVTQ